MTLRTLTGIVDSVEQSRVALADATGEVFARYGYGPFGEDEGVSVRATDALPLALATEVAHANPLRYAGYCYDAFSGHYYLQVRYYDPQTKQFLSKDPATADGEESAYQYCAGDPIHKVDPTGLWGWGGLGRAFSAVKKRIKATPVYRAAARVWNASPAAKVAKRVVKAAKNAKAAIKAKATAAKNWAVDQANRAKVRLAAAQRAAEKRVARERAKRAKRQAAAKRTAARKAKAASAWFTGKPDSQGRERLDQRLPTKPDAGDEFLDGVGVTLESTAAVIAGAAVVEAGSIAGAPALLATVPAYVHVSAAERALDIIQFTRKGTGVFLGTSTLVDVGWVVADAVAPAWMPATATRRAILDGLLGGRAYQ